MRIKSVRFVLAVSAFLFLTIYPVLVQGAASNRQTDTIQTSKGPLRIMPIYHGSVMLEFEGKVIYVDPWSQGDFTGLPQADLILITHTHADHLDRAMIDKLKKPSPIILGSPAVADTINCSCDQVDAMSNGEKKTAMGIEIEAVPMYNIVNGAAPGKPFHHKGVGNGYILTFGDTRIYFSGDTECIPEMKSFKNITVAFIAMNAPRTMSPMEAIECVKSFRPKIVYPYHYRGQNVQDFADGLRNTLESRSASANWKASLDAGLTGTTATFAQNKDTTSRRRRAIFDGVPRPLPDARVCGLLSPPLGPALRLASHTRGTAHRQGCNRP